MPTAQHLRLRCFLEGIEVPIVSAALSIQPDAPAQCQIQIPATDRGHDLLPRTLVHVFYYDYHDGPGDTLTVRVGDEDQVVTSDQQAEAQEEAATAGGVRPPAFDTFFQDPVTTGSVASRPEDDISDEELADLTGVSLDSGPQLPSEGASPDTSARIESSQIRQDENDDPLRDEPANDQKWRLFFCGEVVGYQFVKSYNNRGIILDCMDLSIYWDTCYQYKVNVASLTGNGVANFVGAGTTLFDTFFQSATSTIVDVVSRRSHSRPDLTGLLSGVVHLLERVGGVYTRSRGFKGVNDFFSIAELRLHLIDMICASENDDSSRLMFARRAFNSWTRREGGQLGEIASFREILNLLNRYIFHNVIPCPIAKFEPPSSWSTSRTARTRYNLTDTDRGRALITRANSIRSSMISTRNIYNDALTERRDVTAGETAFDDVVATASAPDATVSGTPSSAEIARVMVPRLTSHGNSLRELASSLQSAGAGSSATSALSARQKMQEAASRVGASSAYSELVYQIILEGINDLDDAIEDIQGVSGTRTRTRTTRHETPARVNSQILRPDIFMVAPPRCNVLFPELYSQMQFSRQYLREVTRMRLTVSDEIFGPDSLLDNQYYAPDIEVLGQRVRQGARAAGERAEGATLRQAAYSCRLMDHELFTGVVPVFERMNEVNIYAARAQMVTRRGAQVPYVMRAANFQFFKNRMAPRSMSLSGKFNPYVAPGFPMAVIDRYMTKEGLELSNLRGLDLLGESLSRGWARVIEERDEQPYLEVSDDFAPIDVWLALQQTVPTQFVGLLMSVQHTVSQSMAGTSYTLTTARTHRERDELLGSNIVQVSRRQASQATRTTVVAALEGEPPQSGQLGPWYGLVTNVEQVERTGSFHLFGTFGGDLPRRQRVLIPVGITQPARSYGPEVVAMVGDRNLEVTFRAFQITEEVDRWRGQRVEVPMEDFLRPPWMSEVWASARVGGVYQQFFGTGAITDPMVIDTGTTREMSTTDQEELDAETDSRNYTIQDPIQADGRTNQSADMDITVERAIDLLVKSYSEIRHAGLDIHEFIRAYIWRPVATIDEMLGSRDLQIDAATGQAMTGIEGFHSRAFGRGEMGRNLRNLVPENMTGTSAEDQEEDSYSIAGRLLGIGTGQGEDRRNLLTRLDKRSEKGDAVMAYVEELWASRGLLG